MKISFIGLGKLGLPCAEVFVEKGHSVKGYDIQEVYSSLVEIESTIEEAVSGVNIVFIAVPTPHDPLYDGRFPISHLPPKDFVVLETLLRILAVVLHKDHTISRQAAFFPLT